MKKIILSFLLVILLIAVAVVYSILNTAETISKCVYFAQTPERVILIGRAKSFHQEGNWVMVNFNLCESNHFGVTNVRVFIPKDEHFIYAGQSLAGQNNYSWSRLSVDLVGSVLDASNLLAVPTEELQSEDQIKAEVVNGQRVIYDVGVPNTQCEDDPWCSQRLAYFKNYGEIQKAFFSALRQRDVIHLWLAFVLNKVTILSDQFGKVSSAANLKDLVENSNF